jgi:hypothetical protein
MKEVQEEGSWTWEEGMDPSEDQEVEQRRFWFRGCVIKPIEEGDKGGKRKENKKNFSKYCKGLCCVASNSLRSCSKKDELCGFAHNSRSKRSQKD